MEKSIESIWKEGFLDNESLIAPKINNLYDQKSMHIIDKFKRVGKANLKWIIIGAIFMLIVSFMVRVPVAGIVLAALLMWIVILGRRQAHALDLIDNSQSSYDYLTAFIKWKKQATASFMNTYRFVYPLLFLTIMLGHLFAELPFTDGSVMDEIMADPDTVLWNGLPIFWVIGVAIVVMLSAVFSGALYKFDVDIVYGRIFRKIDEIFQEMQELKG